MHDDEAFIVVKSYGWNRNNKLFSQLLNVEYGVEHYSHMWVNHRCSHANQHFILMVSITRQLWLKIGLLLDMSTCNFLKVFHDYGLLKCQRVHTHVGVSRIRHGYLCEMKSFSNQWVATVALAHWIQLAWSFLNYYFRLRRCALPNQKPTQANPT